LIGIALVLSIGLHWPILQSVAWMGMLVSYSRDVGVQEAITRTFDGKHPCKLCNLVAEGKKAEKKNPTDTSLKKLDLACVAETARFVHPDVSAPLTPYCFPVRQRFQPPIPPPPDLA
jgi:hypothetical protein